jgi:catechol 2,3-dioxygenase-like lactoylglutathione lyase family enzyme
LVVDTVNLKPFLWLSRMFLIQWIDEAASLCVAYSASYRPVEKCRPQTAQGNKTGVLSMIEGISAITLGTHEMPRTVRFYRALGFEVLHGGEESSFTSLRAGASYLNLIVQPAERRWFWWGRVIFYVTDVDALYNRALAAGYQPATVPRDAEWGERFFHLVDPDGHELSFARPLLPVSVQ